MEHLQGFLPTVLSPETLIVKMSGGRQVRCKDMVHYFKSYMEILSVRLLEDDKEYFYNIQADDMPDPKTMLNVTIEANNVVSMSAAREMYEEKMEELVGGDK